MIKILLINFATLTINPFHIQLQAQTSNPALENLVELSDFIIQGTIKRKELGHHNFGSLEYMYTIQVESIYKGNPDVYEGLKIEFIQPGEQMSNEDIDDKIDILYFNRGCVYYPGMINPPINYINENCYDVGDNLIVFLKQHQTNPDPKKSTKNVIYSYELVDEWLGVLSTNNRLTEDIRKICGNQK